MLNVHTPSEGYNLLEYLSKKYGPGVKQNFGSPDSPLNQAATSLGFTFNTERRIVNSLNAHRLVEFAKERDQGNKMMKILFSHYFENADDISQTSKLIEYGEECGFDRNEVKELLEGEIYQANVMEADKHAKTSMRISGVPFISVTCTNQNDSDKPIVLRGAPSDEHMTMLFDHFLA